MTPTPSSDDPKTRLLAWIDADQAEIVAFLSGFLQAKSPNPPGDTREADAHVRALLEREALPFRTSRQAAPAQHRRHLHGCRPGRHLVLNGHMDVFPRSRTARASAGSGAARSPRAAPTAEARPT
jgi:succinyl-diaminopimelate desuccinylase